LGPEISFAKPATVPVLECHAQLGFLD
jgi:hypothetical protein